MCSIWFACVELVELRTSNVAKFRVNFLGERLMLFAFGIHNITDRPRPMRVPVHIGQWEKRDVTKRSFEQNIEETVSE